MQYSALYSSYRRYKADSDFVVTWLATTTAKCGFVEVKNDELISSSRSGRLNMKTRNETRAAASAQVEPDEHARKVDMQDLVPMARCIVKATDPDIKIPEAFAYFLKEAISERKRHQVWYRKQQSTPGIVASDAKHQHFIGELETVQKVLSPKLAARPLPDADLNRVEANGNAGFANIFSNLEVEDASEECFGDEIRREFITPRTTTCTAWHSVEETDPFLAAAYLLGDFHRIRGLIRNVWKSYQSRTIDLVTAAVTTNTAIDFMRSIQEDTDNSYSEPIDWHKYVCVYCIYLLDKDGIDWNAESNKGFCLVPAYRSLQYIVRTYEDDPSDFVPTVALELVELYGSSVDSASMTARERNILGVKLAMSVIPEFCLLTRNPNHQAEHEIIGGLREVLRHNKLIFWVTCAVQFGIEIRHILRENVVSGFSDLLHGANLITTRIQRVLKFHSITKMGKTMAQIDQSHRNVLELVDRWTKNDYVAARRNDIAVDPSAYQHIGDYYLLRRDPLWCGLLLYNFGTVAYQGALVTANSCGSILALAHLHNAVQQANLLSTPWQSMDFVLSSQRVKELFIGNLPTTAEACAKRLALAMGLSPLSFAPDRRSFTSQCPSLKPRELSLNTPISWIFKKTLQRRRWT